MMLSVVMYYDALCGGGFNCNMVKALSPEFPQNFPTQCPRNQHTIQCLHWPCGMLDSCETPSSPTRNEPDTCAKQADSNMTGCQMRGRTGSWPGAINCDVVSAGVTQCLSGKVARDEEVASHERARQKEKERKRERETEDEREHGQVSIGCRVYNKEHFHSPFSSLSLSLLAFIKGQGNESSIDADSVSLAVYTVKSFHPLEDCIKVSQ